MKRLFATLVVALAAASVLLPTSSARADDYRWSASSLTGPLTGGNWGDATSWRNLSTPFGGYPQLSGDGAFFENVTTGREFNSNLIVRVADVSGNATTTLTVATVRFRDVNP